MNTKERFNYFNFDIRKICSDDVLMTLVVPAGSGLAYLFIIFSFVCHREIPKCCLPCLLEEK